MATEKTLLSGNEFERSCITLLRELEASLQGSRRALLALDLAGLECGTREQVNVIGRFEPLLQRQSAAAGSAQDGYRIFVKPANVSALQTELQQCAHRVREATRLQAALLARAQAKLWVLANMLAGPSATYEQLYEQRPRTVATTLRIERREPAK
jgi:hypothetical protein